MSHYDDDWFDMDDCVVVRETDKAMLVEYFEDNVWLPKSQLFDDPLPEIGYTGTVRIAGWLARQHGWSEDK